jgi:lysophospholipase L1-like esterase
MIGTNDGLGLRPARNGSGRALGTIIDKLSKRHHRDVIRSPLAPKEVLIEAKPVQRADAVNAYNALAKARVKERALAGERITFAEVNRVLSVADLADGVHPTPEGYVKVGNAFYEAARSVLPEP